MTMEIEGLIMFTAANDQVSSKPDNSPLFFKDGMEAASSSRKE